MRSCFLHSLSISIPFHLPVSSIGFIRHISVLVQQPPSRQKPFFFPLLWNIPGFQWLLDEKGKDDMRQCDISGLIFRVMILLEGRGNGEKRLSLSSLMLADFLSNVMCFFPLCLSLALFPIFSWLLTPAWGRKGGWMECVCLCVCVCVCA